MTSTSTLQGILLIDKPGGMTSHDVIDRVRRLAGMRKVGHAGTLDPMAEGLLVVALGGATRVMPFLVGLGKTYAGAIEFGAISSTYDAEGSITRQAQPLPASAGAVAAAMREQVGLRSQLAPPYSAVKVRGRKLYEYARAGEPIPAKPRMARIDEFALLDYAPPQASFLARVGSGVYIRSMAHDLGIRLGCGAFLASLRRLAVGEFRVENATPLDALEKMPDLIVENLLTIPEALTHLPHITVGPEAESALRHGRGFTTGEIESCESIPRLAEASLVLNSRGEALSIVKGEPIPPNGAPPPPAAEESDSGLKPIFFRPVRVLAAAD